MRKSPEILKEIDFDKITNTLIDKASKKPSRLMPITKNDYMFSENIIRNSYLENLRPDNFCIDLSSPKMLTNGEVIKYPIDKWSKEQRIAVAKMCAIFSDEVSGLLKKKQAQGLDKRTDVQMLWVRLPEKNKTNLKAINGIIKSLSNNGYEDKTGNEDWISLQRYINPKRSNPVPRPSRAKKSVSVVIVTDTNKVLLLKRAGRSGRAGTWGTLTGTVDKGKTNGETVIKEVNEEINYLIKNERPHYIGIASTPNMGKDLALKGKTVTYSDDYSSVYGIKIPENTLKSTIKLDAENSKWKLFSREDLMTYFKLKGGSNVVHVALAKALSVLNCARNNFKNVKVLNFTYPYTNSPGIFVQYQQNAGANAREKNSSDLDEKNKSEVLTF